ncbi:hypothetical protein Vretimale_12845 [Volvox reticuliferus]|uniref:Uncharacterized protein n=1 Tax=Volvox reticuliferus TaxID=1737510 RepID=A0A8J4CCV5_9CHLO|nr:hypothetical protein Vretifemale_9227 [Volvox reticuliferus]GIM08938.1 hypothetical protein Vretimale_12845 [Volvox reticuliferus]
MQCQGSAQETEHELQRMVAGLAETDPAYAATLSDLAVMKLSKGEVMEAQRMFERLVELRSEQLEQASSSVASSDKEQASDTGTDRRPAAASPLPPPPQPGRRTHSEGQNTLSVSAATKSSPSSLPRSNPPLSAPSLPGSSNSKNNTNVGNSSSSIGNGSSKPRAQQDAPSSRPRGCSGSSASAMAVGAAMFARALGNRPASARPKRRVSGPEPGAEAPAPLASSAPAETATASPAPAAAAAAITTAPIGLDSESMGHGLSIAAGSRSSSPTRVAVVAAAQEQEQRGLAGRREPAGRATSKGSVADAARAARAESGGSGCGESATTAPGAAAPAAAMVTATTVTAAAAACPGSSESRRRRTSSGTGEVRLSSSSAGEVLGVAGYATTLVPERKVAAPATGTPVGATGESSSAGRGGGSTEDNYLSAAAAAVAAMTAKPTDWGQDRRCGAATGARSESRSGGGGAAGGGNSSGGGGGGGGGCTAVKEYYLESRGQNGTEADPEAAEADAALRTSLGECRHVLEVYGLTTEIRTSHLQEFVLELASQDGRPLPVIKWVDDNHALLVCPDGATGGSGPVPAAALRGGITGLPGSGGIRPPPPSRPAQDHCCGGEATAESRPWNESAAGPGC